jgi:single-stranded-DNA-specific exonuclease
MKEIFIRAGGHAAAAGCTIAPGSLDDFRTRLNEYVATARPDGPQAPTRSYDLAIKLADVNLGLLDILTQLEPFGMGNPKPTFRIDGCTVSATRPIGADGKHLSLVLTQAGEKRRAVAWGKAEALAAIAPGDQVDVLAHVRENDWRGTRSAELEVVDVAR